MHSHKTLLSKGFHMWVDALLLFSWDSYSLLSKGTYAFIFHWARHIT